MNIYWDIFKNVNKIRYYHTSIFRKLDSRKNTIVGFSMDKTSFLEFWNWGWKKKEYEFKKTCNGEKWRTVMNLIR